MCCIIARFESLHFKRGVKPALYISMETHFVQLNTLKELLTEIISAAKVRDQPLVTRLSHQFEDLVPTSLKNYNDYDNLRQSCLYVFKFPEMYEECIKDAEERFARIYVETDSRKLRPALKS